MWRTKTVSMQHGFSAMEEAMSCMQQNLSSMLQRLEKTEELVQRTRQHWERVLMRRQNRARGPIARPSDAFQSASASAS
jgi:hypothetical protein